MNNPEPKITNVEAIGEIEDIGADAAKVIPSHSRYRYKQALRYTVNGNSEHGTARGKTKPELKKRIESAKNDATLGRMYAWYQDGVFIGTQVRW